MKPGFTSTIAFSARFKDAFKMALAMVITYAIALSQGWGTPFWAGFAVVFCGLTAVGDSLNKGLLRVFGTLFGAIVSLALLALFPQDRWAFLIAMSLFIAFCSFMMGGTTRWYFWFMAGITVPIVTVTGEPDALNNFTRAVMRTQQTTLGIVVYSLVSILIWPTSSRSDFEGAVRKLLGNQRKLFTRYMTQLTGGSGDPLGEDGAAQLRGEVTRALGGLHTRLDHAELDTYEIWEVRRAWRGSVAQLGALNSTMEALRQTFHELGGIDAQRYIKSMPAVGTELDARLAAIEGMLDGQAPAHQPVDLACEPDRTQLAELSHFQQSAVLLAISHLTQLERETRALFDAIRYIRGFGSAYDAGPVADVPAARAPLDPDWLIGVLRVMAVLWLNLLLYIYVPDLPVASGLVIVGNVFAMLMLLHPQMRPFVLFWPMAFGTLIGAVAHVLIMPHLSGYLELGTMLFVAVFGLVYLLYSPQQILFRFCGLAFFMVLVSIDVPQHYSFLTAVNLGLVFPMILGGLALTGYFPVSLRPEDRFQAILGRFFRSSAFLMATTGWSRDRAPSRLQRWRKAFHLNEVASAPQRLGTWAHALPPGALGTTTPAQIQDLVTSLQALSDRMKTLMQARTAHQSDAMVRELREDMHSWRVGVQAIFARLASVPEAADFADYRSRLDAKLERLEARIAEVLERADERGLSTEEGENMHRLLGAHRGVSEALVGLATQTAAIEWPRLREARF
jgi:uncharacterized membrane protein YccC